MKPHRSRLRPVALVQIGVVALGALMVAVLPVLSRVQAAGRQTATPTPHASTTASSRASGTAATTKTTAGRTFATSIRVTVKASASVGPLETIVQTLNNCGPSSVAEVLAYWRIYRTEAQVAAVLRADNAYWGMSPVGLPAYARSLGMRALVGYGGTEKLIKLLIANGFPVIASQYVSSSDPIRHYRPIEAYNDRTQTFVSADPYLGAGHVISYGEFNAIWAESDYRFQVIYPASQQNLLNAVLRAAGWNEAQAYRQAIRWSEAQMQSADFQVPGSWIWYNGYVDVAFDEAQLGQFRKARAELAKAARQGISPVMIGWVRAEIQALQHSA